MNDDVFTLPPMHPGEVLREEFMQPLGLTAYALARRIGIQRSRIERIARETGPITPDTALRLAKAFRMTPDFWMGLQTSYDLGIARRSIESEIERIEPIAA